VIADCGELHGEEHAQAANKAPDTSGDPYEDYPEDQKQGGQEFEGKEIVKIATELKDMGNKAFKEQKNELGLSKYQKGLRYLHEYPEPLDSDAPELGNQLNALKISLHSNSALLQLKLNQYADAEKSASNALAVPDIKDADKGKALYRRALARKQLKNESEAVTDLEEAVKYVPNDAGIKNELATTKARQAERLKKEKAAYSKFFS